MGLEVYIWRALHLLEARRALYLLEASSLLDVYSRFSHNSLDKVNKMNLDQAGSLLIPRNLNLSDVCPSVITRFLC